VGAVLRAAPSPHRRRALDAAAAALLLCAAGACGPTSVRHERTTSAAGLPRPPVVYVYDFAVDPSEVQLDPGGPLAHLRENLVGSDESQDQQAIDLGHQVADVLADALVQRIVAMGLTAQRAGRADRPPPEGLGVAGQFADVDQANRIRRIAIGFHQGQSHVSARVQLYQMRPAAAPAKLFDFIATAASAPLPGAAVTVQADADRLADQIAYSLQEFFARQGWTAAPPSLPPF
jgi:hypothetical protein